MRKSKLESYEDLLEALMEKPLTLDELAYSISTDCVNVKRYLEFLVKNGLVKERIENSRTLHAITERGTTVLKALNFNKYLTKIANKIGIIEEILQAIHEIEKGNKKNKI